MRTSVLLLLLLAAGNLQAQAPAPGPAHPDDRAGVGAQAGSASVPAGAQERRNWLLARLIVDQDFDQEKIRSIEKSLAQMSPDQIDVLVRVYQDRLRQREAIEQVQLDEARANLEQMKAYRDAVAQNLDYLRVYRQAQYLSFGTWYGRMGGFGSGGLGYGGYGYGGPGFAGPGYGGYGYGGYGYGSAYPYYGYGYGAGMPGYGGTYPLGGGYLPGMGAGY
jgi:hypothetical protein